MCEGECSDRKQIGCMDVVGGYIWMVFPVPIPSLTMTFLCLKITCLLNTPYPHVFIRQHPSFSRMTMDQGLTVRCRPGFLFMSFGLETGLVQSE